MNRSAKRRSAGGSVCIMLSMQLKDALHSRHIYADNPLIRIYFLYYPVCHGYGVSRRPAEEDFVLLHEFSVSVHGA
jgi:hypothetical protein